MPRKPEARQRLERVAPGAATEVPAPDPGGAAAGGVLTWPREGIPAGSGYLVAPGGGGYPEVRIAVPDDPDGEAAALAEALNDPEVEAALRGGPDAPSIPEEEVYAEFGYTPLARRYSGNVRVRLPNELHRTLAAQAKQQGVSLNTLIVSYLAAHAARTEAVAGTGR